ncbi:MAG: hypothetical protein ACLP8S_31650, partial [Solirubrobacteraceae bacterium]
APAGANAAWPASRKTPRVVVQRCGSVSMRAVAPGARAQVRAVNVSCATALRAAEVWYRGDSDSVLNSTGLWWKVDGFLCSAGDHQMGVYGHRGAARFAAAPALDWGDIPPPADW